MNALSPSERRAGERIAVQQQLVDRIVGQSGGVVAVGVATGQAEHALAHQVAQRVGNLARLPPVAEGAGHLRRQRQPVVDQLQQEGAAVGAGVRLIEAGDDRLGIPVDPCSALYRLWPSSLLACLPRSASTPLL